MRRSLDSAKTSVPDAYLTDTGVFVRWFVPQDGYEHARDVRDRFLAGTLDLHAVDVARVELAHVLRKKGVLAGRMTRQQYLDAVRAVDDLDVRIHRTDADALERSGALSITRSLRFFDALLVDRAMVEDLPLLTTDLRLVRAVDDLVSTEVLRGVAGGRDGS